jgi:2-methylcitrate dehydratase PrpD
MNLTKREFKNQYSNFRKQKRSILNIDKKVEFITNSEFRSIYTKSSNIVSAKISLYKKIGYLKPEYKKARGVNFY